MSGWEWQPSRDCWYARVELQRGRLRCRGREARANLRPAERQTEDPGGYTSDAGCAGAGECEEDAAYKAFQAVNPNDAAKKIESGEAFLLKYPESRYKSPSTGADLRVLAGGDTQKMQEYGEKESRWRRTSLYARATGADTASGLAWERIRSRCRAGAGQSGTILQASHRDYTNAPEAREYDR